MRRLAALLALGAFLNIAVVAFADSSPPTTAQEKAFVSGRATAYANDATAWDAERDAFDNGPAANFNLPYFHGIRDLRPYLRNSTQNCLNQTTLAATRTCLTNLQADFARPGPAHSLAKDLHTATRQFGDDALRTFNSHTADMRQRAALFP